MYTPAVLSPDHLPEQELITASMDGELQRVGGAFCPVDTIVGTVHRAASIALETPNRAIAEQRTAAWIYGAALTLTRPLQLCMDARTRVRPVSSRMLIFREVVIDDNEIRLFDGFPVTSPLRTTVDLARFSAEFTADDCNIVRQLAKLDSFCLQDCLTTITERRNLPNKHLALERLENAMTRS